VAIEDHLERVLGIAVVRMDPVGGGLTSAECFRVTLDGGRTVFLKVGRGEAADDVRHEGRVLQDLQAPMLPGFVGVVDAEVPALITET
jgi:hypothetical protein